MKKLLKNKVIQNYLYNVSYQIVMTILPVITVPYLTRVLGGENLGIARYLESVVTLFTVFGMLGLVWYANRAVAYSRGDKKRLSQCFWEIFIMRCLLLIVTMIVYVMVAVNSAYSTLYFIYGIHVVGTFLDVGWFFTGVEEMKPVVIRNYIIRAISTILLFVLVRSASDVGTYIALTSVTTLANAILLFPWLRKFIQPVSIKEIHVFKHFLPSLALFLPQAASQLYVQCDKIMIKNMLPDVAYVSYYTENEKIAKLPIVLATALSTVLMPRIASEYIKGKDGNIKFYIEKSLFSTCLVLLPCCTGLMAVANNFVPIFLGKEFADTYGILIALCPIMVLIGISNVTGIQYLVALNKTKELTISYILALVSNLSVNFLLIPSWGVYGAALGTIAAELLVVVVQYYCMRKELGRILDVDKYSKVLLISVLMGVIVYLINFLELNIYMTLGVQIVAGIVVYGVGIVGLQVVEFKSRLYGG